MIDWEAYFEAMATLPVHPLLRQAQPLFTGGEAVDLGCGAGQAAELLANHGYQVLAVDIDPRALALTRERCAGLPVEVRACDMRELEIPRCDLIHCGFALFLLSSAEVGALFDRIRTALRPGGLFIGQFLGPNDDWITAASRNAGTRLPSWAHIENPKSKIENAETNQPVPSWVSSSLPSLVPLKNPKSKTQSPFSSHIRIEIERLLAGFNFFYFEEVERDGAAAWGENKHWHVTHVIAEAGHSIPPL